MGVDTILEVKNLARKFTEENFTNPTPMDYLVIENAMIRAVIHMANDVVTEREQGNERTTS